MNTISTNDTSNDFGGGASLAFEMQRRWRCGRAQNLIRLIIERDRVAISPDAPQLKSFNVAAPKSKKIELHWVSGKIDRDRLRRATAFPADFGHADIGAVDEGESVPRGLCRREMASHS